MTYPEFHRMMTSAWRALRSHVADQHFEKQHGLPPYEFIASMKADYADWYQAWHTSQTVMRKRNFAKVGHSRHMQRFRKLRGYLARRALLEGRISPQQHDLFMNWGHPHERKRRWY